MGVAQGSESCLTDTTIVDFASGLLGEAVIAMIDTHLAHCEPCQSLVAVSLGGRAAPQAPLRIDRYEILGVLGIGAMGTVYRAYDETLEREVALKVLQQTEEGARRRFLEEARAMAKIRHRNVLSVYEVCESGDVPYFTMELVECGNLADWLLVPRSQNEIVGLFVQVGLGLAAAHDAGILHCDVKPENVLVEVSGAARVADFGLAKRASEDKCTYGGTPRYMAPELLCGAPPTIQSDQFSFALMFFEALFGTASFARLGQTGPSRPQHSSRIRRRQASLYRAVARALESDPELRYFDMAQMLAALAKAQRRRITWPFVLAGGGFATLGFVVAFGLLSQGIERPDMCQPTLSPWLAGSNQGLDLEMAAYWSRWRKAQAHSCQRLQSMPSDQQALGELSCLRYSYFQFEALAGLATRPLAAVPTGSSEHLQPPEDCAFASPTQQRTSSLEDEALALLAAAQSSEWAGDLESAQTQYARAVALVREQDASHEKSLVLLAATRAVPMVDGERELLGEALQSAQSVDDHALASEAAAALASHATKFGSVQAANEWLALAEISYSKAISSPKLRLGLAMSRADILVQTNQITSAAKSVHNLCPPSKIELSSVPCAVQAISIATHLDRAGAIELANAYRQAGAQRWGARSPHLWRIESSGIGAHILSQNFAEAEAIGLRLVAAMDEYPLALAPRLLSLVLHQLATVAILGNGDSGSAEAFLERSKAADPFSASTNQLGRNSLRFVIEIQKRNYEEALLISRENQALARRVAGGMDSWRLAGALRDESRALAKLERLDEAVSTSTQAVALLSKTLGEAHEDVILAKMNFAGTLRLAGRYSDARAISLAVYDELKKSHRHHRGMAQAQADIAQSLASEGRHDEAVEAYELALNAAKTLERMDKWKCQVTTGMGISLLEAKRYSEAVVTLESNTELAASLPDSKDAAHNYYMLAKSLGGLGQRAASRLAAKKALAAARQSPKGQTLTKRISGWLSVNK